MINGGQRIALLFLGRPQVLMDGEDATVQITAKHLALVAYLAASAPERLARTKTATTFWSEKSDDASLYRLRHALWELRRTIGNDLLKSDNRSCWLCLDDGVKVDILEFRAGCKELPISEKSFTKQDIENLRGLVTLYRGDLLDGLNVREAPLFEEWLLSERERLQLLYLDALWFLAKKQASAGKLDEAVQTLNRLIEADPLRERSYRALMSIHQRQGDKTTALKVYTKCTNILNSELGIAPSPATKLVRQKVLQDSPESAGTELEHASHLLKEGKRQAAWDICAAIETSSANPATVSQATLLRAEIALAEGRQGESLGLVRAARLALGRLFGG